MTRTSRLVLLSNSVPKSGSSFLFESQQIMFENLFGAKNAEERLKEFGIDFIGDFVNVVNNPQFYNMIAENGPPIGPIVVKIHAVVTPELQASLLANDNVFMSLAVRDPMEIFFSARNHNAKTGEFQGFDDINLGTTIINKYYAEIYRSVLQLNESYASCGAADRRVPIVRYETIVGDPTSALLVSLPQRLRAVVIRSLLSRCFSEKEARKRAAYRLKTGRAGRKASDENPQEVERVRALLRTTSTLFGYGNPDESP